MIDAPVSPLRRRMIEDMTIRGFTAKTQHHYIRHVRNFAVFLGRSPVKADAEVLRHYQLHLSSSGVDGPSLNSAVSALRFFFKVTLGRRDVTELMLFVREPQRLPEVLSVDEVAELLRAAPGLKYRAALSVAYGAGLRALGGDRAQGSDIDNGRMLIRVEQGKGRKDRFVMLSPHLLEILRAWWKEARPRGWLFPGPRFRPADDDTAVEPRLSRRGCRGRHRQTRLHAHPQALRHPPAQTEDRRARHPGSARAQGVGDDGPLHPGGA